VRGETVVVSGHAQYPEIDIAYAYYSDDEGRSWHRSENDILAWPDEGLVVGGLEGDYHKGPLRGDLPGNVERGVKLHRAIDAYTDHHPRITRLRQTFPSGLRRYAGILIDLCFDHYLSLHWERFSSTPLKQFSGQVYDILSRHESAMSEASRHMLTRMVEHDLLDRYREWETVPLSAERIGRRFRRSNPLVDVDRGLAPLRRRLEQTFLAFYPELQAFSDQWEPALITDGNIKD
jgi:acyl carrier protein phosphodiesterase